MVKFKALKKKIFQNKVKTIWYSSRTGWWTHDPKDLERAGRMFHDRKIEELTAKMNKSQDLIERQKIRNVIEKLRISIPQIPLDPSGAPLYIADNPKIFIKNAENNPDHYGEHGLDAFMKAHHKNCNGHCHADFDLYFDEPAEN